MESLEERIATLEAWVADHADAHSMALKHTADVNTAWLLWCGILVFFMQVGFAMLEVGSVSLKNTQAVLIKNVLDAALGAICWWILGHGLAYGRDAGGFIGTGDFVLRASRVASGEKGVEFGKWFFQWAFAATAATIVSGAMAERIRIVAYVQLSIFIAVFIYPVVVHWAWSLGGWASPFRCTDRTTAEDYQACRSNDRSLLLGCGSADFAGAGVVHLTGGVCAVVAAAVVKPRTGRFRGDGCGYRLPQQIPALQTLGALIIWVGWYGFSGGSIGPISSGRSTLAAKTMVNTTIAAASGVISMSILVKVFYKKFESTHLNNGVLSGLVAISSSGPLVDADGALITGICASAFYLLGIRILRRFKIDDVVQASAVHLGCGAWGLIASGFFVTRRNYRDVYSYRVFADPGRDAKCCGLLYGCRGRLLGANLFFLLAIIAWAAGLTYLAVRCIKAWVGLRVPLNVETLGLDTSRHVRSKESAPFRVALRTAANKSDRGSGASSHRTSLRTRHAENPRGGPPLKQLPHWRDVAQTR